MIAINYHLYYTDIKKLQYKDVVKVHGVFPSTYS